MPYDDPPSEVLDRVRRIETRLTMFLEASGFDTKVRRPLWDGTRRRVIVPNPSTPLKDCVAAIPEAYRGQVTVYCKDDLITTIIKA